MYTNRSTFSVKGTVVLKSSYKIVGKNSVDVGGGGVKEFFFSLKGEKFSVIAHRAEMIYHSMIINLKQSTIAVCEIVTVPTYLC